VYHAESGAMVPKDKAFKKYIARNMVKPSTAYYLKNVTLIDGYVAPKMYITAYYCIVL